MSALIFSSVFKATRQAKEVQESPEDTGAGQMHRKTKSFGSQLGTASSRAIHTKSAQTWFVSKEHKSA